jgi:hypothetical protein
MNRIGVPAVTAAMRRPATVLLLLVLASCQAPAPAPGGTLAIVALAGPTCPVETDPPDPDCAPRPVAGAQVVVSPGDGRDIAVAEGATDARGRLTLAVPPGDYIVTAGTVEGLMGTPQPVEVSVDSGRTTDVEIAYDTGIR